jgi:hypothetical protein
MAAVCGVPGRSREATAPATSTGGLEAELNLLGWIGQMSAAAEERRRHDVSCPPDSAHPR